MEGHDLRLHQKLAGCFPLVYLRAATKRINALEKPKPGSALAPSLYLVDTSPHPQPPIQVVGHALLRWI